MVYSIVRGNEYFRVCVALVVRMHKGINEKKRKKTRTHICMTTTQSPNGTSPLPAEPSQSISLALLAAFRVSGVSGVLILVSRLRKNRGRRMKGGRED